MKRLFYQCLVTLLFIMFNSVSAQNNLSMAQKKPAHNENVLVQNAVTVNGYNSVQAAYNGALREAKNRFSEKKVDVRNLKKGEIIFTDDGMAENRYNYTIVELPSAVDRALSTALSKALANIDEESRFAIDKIVVTNDDVDKKQIKGEVIDLLTRKGHKVVAKEYLEKLYAEIQNQNSGAYNKKTVVKGNNFSGTGYYVSISISDEYIQVQVINVSTGEYDGNAIVNF